MQASKNEVRLAVDIYNRSGTERQLEAFLVHMNLGWLKLLQARTEESGGDLYIRDQKGWRVRHRDGDFKYRPLTDLMGEAFASGDPRVKNIEFMTRLRNRVEHRHDRDVAALVAGRTQAHLLNYENTLTEWFGDAEALADEIRFPLFLSSITGDAVDAVKRMRSRIPTGVLEWIQDFDSTLDPTVTSDQRFDFRIYLIEQTGPKTEADLAMTFVRSRDLTAAQEAVIERARTVIREKRVPVSDMGHSLPSQVVTRVNQALAVPFNLHMHTQAWRHFKVRPSEGAADRYATRADFCTYNDTFHQYSYTEAWVNFLIRKMADPDTYEAVRAWTPPSDAA